MIYLLAMMYFPVDFGLTSSRACYHTFAAVTAISYAQPWLLADIVGVDLRATAAEVKDYPAYSQNKELDGSTNEM
jgi:hypothetical protein